MFYKEEITKEISIVASVNILPSGMYQADVMYITPTKSMFVHTVPQHTEEQAKNCGMLLIEEIKRERNQHYA